MGVTMEQEILAHEARLTEATQSIDLDALDRLYAEDVLMTSVLGDASCTKATIMDEARRGLAQRDAAAMSGRPVDIAYHKEDLKVTLHGGTAVTSYRFIVTIRSAESDVTRRYRTTNVWAKREGRWQVVAAHTAFVLDAQQAARLAGDPATQSAG